MNTFKINEKILYGSVGACVISEITQKTFGGQTTDYYVLVPLYKDHSTIYVPVNSQILCEKMRRMSDPEALEALFEIGKDEELQWEENKYTRRDTFNSILEKGCNKELFMLVRLLLSKQAELTSNGKRLHISDERILIEAKRIIEDEFACVLNLPREDASEYIEKRANKQMA